MKEIKFTATFDERRRMFGDRMIKGSKMFVTSNIDSIIADAFNNTDLARVGFKSKAWQRLKSKGTKLNITAIRHHYGFDNNIAIVFSHYCGCSMCPCSPGYNVSPRTQYGKELLRDKGLNNTDVFVNINFDEQVVNTVRTHLNKFIEEFEQEKLLCA
jgi:hypothetical protein